MNLPEIIRQNARPIRFLTSKDASPYSYTETCGACGGEGYIGIPIFKGHTEGHDIKEQVCEVCKGSGRLRVTVTVMVEPFKPKRHEG